VHDDRLAQRDQPARVVEDGDLEHVLPLALVERDPAPLGPQPPAEEGVVEHRDHGGDELRNPPLTREDARRGGDALVGIGRGFARAPCEHDAPHQRAEEYSFRERRELPQKVLL
jgi:hypothetical protein